jgi:hypothetical protein
MRVMVLSHHVGHTDPVGDSLPALTTARLKYKTDNYAFVPKSAEAIPNCD